MFWLFVSLDSEIGRDLDLILIMAILAQIYTQTKNIISRAHGAR